MIERTYSFSDCPIEAMLAIYLNAQDFMSYVELHEFWLRWIFVTRLNIKKHGYLIINV